MKKTCILLAVLLVFLLCLSSCSKKPYSEEDFIGLSSIEIVEKYGEFDIGPGWHHNPGDDGLYRDCSCGYLVTPERVGFLGTEPAEYFMIYFNEDGIADFCEYRQYV